VQTIDETIDLALNLLEGGVSGDTEKLCEWIVDNLVHVLDEYHSGHVSRCMVAETDVLRVGEHIALVMKKTELMRPEQARMLAAALLRAAEAADQEL
jgi:hypothetical protein